MLVLVQAKCDLWFNFLFHIIYKYFTVRQFEYAMRVFTNWYYSQIWFNIYFQQSLEVISFCITASYHELILSMQCYTKRRRKGDWYKWKGSRENEEYTWINLSAREALSYKTKISTKDSRDKPEDSLKHTKKEYLIASQKKCNVRFPSRNVRRPTHCYSHSG